MTKLAVILIATFAFQGAFGAAIKYDDDFKFINLWNEIELEIKDVVLHLKNDNGDLNTVTRQCQNLGKVIETIIDQLHQATIDHEQGDIIFKRVMYIFKEVQRSLKLFPKNSSTVQIKSKVIYSLETVMEDMEQLVFIAKTYCPQLRALLRTILVDFLEFVRGFRSNDGILEKDAVIYESPHRMLAQIKEVTRQFTDMLSECNHMEEMRMVLRGYVRYVEEIIHKLEDQIINDKEVCVVLQRLADELRRMFVPLMKMMIDEVYVDVKAFRTELIAHFLSINSVFDELLELVDYKNSPTDVKNFVEKIIYFYYYTIKQTHFEVRTAYKNSFYGRNYHEFFVDNDTSEFVGEAEKMFRNVFDSEKFEIDTPEEIVMRIQKLVQRLNGKNWDTKQVAYYARDFVQVLEYVADKISKEVKVHHLASTEGIMSSFYVDLKKIRLQLEGMPSKAEFVRSVQKVFVDLYKIVIVDKMDDNGYEHLLLKDICIEFYNFLNNVFYKMGLISASTNSF